MKTKICHLTSAHAWNDTRIFLKECRSLAKAGYETHLIAPGAPDIVRDSVLLHGVEKPQGRFDRMTKTVRWVYRKAKSIDADIYHIHDAELLLVGILLKFRGKKVIYDAHEDVPRQILSMTWIKKPLRKIMSWGFERWENFGAKRFDVLITATPAIKTRFESIARKIVNVNNYPILSELFTDADWSKKQAAVCYVGAISEARGIYEMVNAIGDSGARFKLAGELPSKPSRAELTRMPGWAGVEEYGQVGREAVRQILSESMAGLVLFHPEPNHVEAQPNKMFEYMSAGIAVIASDFPLWKEVIETNRCGICVEPYNIKRIRDAIRWVVDHPAEARQFGQNGRKAVEEKYNWECEAQKLINAYCDIA